MFAVIRVRGVMDIDKRIEDTMRMMNLKKNNSCVVLPESANVKGMLQKAKDVLTWGEVEKSTLAKMLERRLHAKGAGERRIDAKDLKKATGFDSFDALADAIISGKFEMHKSDKVQVTFGLAPPSKGFSSVHDTYPKGDIGYRGKEINALIERMI